MYEHILGGSCSKFTKKGSKKSGPKCDYHKECKWVTGKGCKSKSKSKSKTKSKSKSKSKSKTKSKSSIIYYTYHDGGVPFKIIINNKNVDIYRHNNTKGIGKYIYNKYVYICDHICEFKTNDKILKFYSHYRGGSSIALGSKNVYFINKSRMTSRSEFKNFPNTNNFWRFNSVSELETWTKKGWKEVIPTKKMFLKRIY